MQHFLLNKDIHTSHYTLINRILGTWIVQNTKYSYINYLDKSSIHTIEWSLIPQKYNKLEFIANKILDKIKNKYYEYYIVRKNNFSINTHFIFLFHDELKEGCIIKLDSKFRVLESYNIKHYSSNYMDIYYSDKKNDDIVEKIYFLNNNLKIIKSVTQKNQKNNAICFSSEIKIS